jgi:ABC-type oligopeptide transport system substrate-binding subunit
MSHRRITVTLAALALTWPLAAAAAPAGKVVIAQGVDPSTLDTMNQQETPASNVAAQIFDLLVERDANLKIVPSPAT